MHCGDGHDGGVDTSALREECPICLEPTRLQGVQCATCRTWYHAGCIVHYLTSDHTRENRCPLCTVPWGEEEIGRPRPKVRSSRRQWYCSRRTRHMFLGSASIFTLVLLLLLL